MPTYKKKVLKAKMDYKNKYIDIVKGDNRVFLQFLKAKFPVFHNSNFFFRDLQYGIQKYFESKGTNLSMGDSETVAVEVGKYLEMLNIFIKVNHQGWRVNYPEFVTSVPGDPF